MGYEIQDLLKEVVNECGIYEAVKPGRCLEMLSQKYGAIKEDFLLLSRAAEYGIAEDLIKERHRMEADYLIKMLASRLIVRMNIDEKTAEWLVNSWAYALGISGPVQGSDAAKRTLQKKIVVGKTAEDGCYDSLYNAIRDIEPGGEIEILPGVYYGHYKIRKPLLIRGVSSEKVVIQSDIMPVFSLFDTEKVSIENLTLKGIGRTDYDKSHIAEIVNSEARIRNCRITGATLSGIFVYGKKSDIRIEDCEIGMCAKSGVVVSDDAKCTLENTLLSSCLDAIIAVRDYANLFLINSRVKDGENTGIRLLNDANLFSDNSEISFNKRAGIIISYNSCSNIKNSSIHHNKGYGIIVSDMSCTTIDNCQVYQNSVSGIRFDKSSDFFNYSSNVNDTIVTISGSRDETDDSVKSDAIDEYVKNPPETSMESPPDTFQSIVIIISFVLVFEITALVIAEIAGVIKSDNELRLSFLLPAAAILGVIAALINIIRRG